MNWQAALGSLGVHALALAAVSHVPALAARAAPSVAAFDVKVVEAAPEPAKTPAEEAPAPVPAPALQPHAPRKVASVTPRPAAPESAPSRPQEKPAVSLGMRRPEEVHVPPPWAAVKIEGPPPSSNELPAAALGGPIAPPDLPGPLRRDRVASRRDRLGENVVADGGGGYREDHITFKARVDEDGKVSFHDRGNVQVDGTSVLPLFIFMGGHFDITDKLMQIHGEDPYRYEKSKFMERTRDERMAMSAEARSRVLAEATVKMPRYLADLWRETSLSVAERKMMIFSLWEEVAEEGDDELVAMGKKIRWEIGSFIRRKLPEGSAEAFSKAELDGLNARKKSKARFAPYEEN